jgi:RimJ/RimL family protein N-acetyltransferase
MSSASASDGPQVPEPSGRESEAAPDALSVPAASERLSFHRWRMEDAEEAFLMYGDPEVVRFIGGQQEPDLETMRERLAFLIERTSSLPPGQGSFPARSLDDGRFVGAGLIKPLPDDDGKATGDIEIGWHVARPDWGQGFAPEMGRALCAYGFERLGLDRLHVVVDPANVRSVAVARKVGCEHHGLSDDYYGRSLEYFTLDASTWRARLST